MTDDPQPQGTGSNPPPLDTQTISAPPPPPPPGYLPPVYPAPPKQKGIGSKVMTSLVTALFLLSILINFYLIVIFVVPTIAGSTEGVYREGTSEERVVIVPVEGGINDEMFQYVQKAFKSLEKDVPEAIVLRINSGGGGVTASDQIWNVVHSFKVKHSDTKIIASFGGIAASGGYYIATPTEYIFCEQTGITGSIGVIAQIPAIEGMIEKLGVEMNIVVADGSTEKAVANNLFEDWHNESGQLTPAGEKNQAVIKNLLNSAYNRFVQVVDNGRPNLTTDEVEKLATGKIFTAEQALQAGLVDEVGYLDQAVDKAVQLAGLNLKTARVTTIRKTSGGLLGLLGARRSSLDLNSVTPDTVRTWVDELGEVRLAYRIQFD